MTTGKGGGGKKKKGGGNRTGDVSYFCFSGVGGGGEEKGERGRGEAAMCRDLRAFLLLSSAAGQAMEGKEKEERKGGKGKSYAMPCRGGKGGPLTPILSLSHRGAEKKGEKKKNRRKEEEKEKKAGNQTPEEKEKRKKKRRKEERERSKSCLCSVRRKKKRKKKGEKITRITTQLNLNQGGREGGGEIELRERFHQNPLKKNLQPNQRRGREGGGKKKEGKGGLSPAAFEKEEKTLSSCRLSFSSH